MYLTEEEIREKSKKKAGLLMDYLEPGENERDGKLPFFLWFAKEQYRWYAYRVALECRAIWKEKRREIWGSDLPPLDLKLSVLFGSLSREMGRDEEYKQLCQAQTDFYIGSYRKGHLDWINDAPFCHDAQNMALTAADYALLHGDKKKAYEYGCFFVTLGGEVSQVADKMAAHLPFEEVTAHYFTGSAVPEEAHQYFVGREGILKDYETAILGRQAGIFVFHGQTRIGKTSLMIHLQSRLRKKNFLIVKMSMDQIGKKHVFCGKVIHELSRVVKKAIKDGETGKVDKTDLADLAECLKEYDNDSRWALEENAFRTLEKLLDRVNDTWADGRILLCMDEFGAVLADGAYKPWKEELLTQLKHYAESGNLTILIAGTAALEDAMQNPGQKTYSGFFDRCKEKEVPYLDKKAVGILLEEPMRMSDHSSRFWDKRVISYLYGETKGHPMITQGVAELIQKGLNGDWNEGKLNIVTMSLAKHAIEQMLESQQSGFGMSWFDALLNCGRTGDDDGDDAHEAVMALCGKIYRGREKVQTKEQFLDGLSGEERRLYKTLCIRGVLREEPGRGLAAQVYMPLFGRWCERQTR